MEDKRTSEETSTRRPRWGEDLEEAQKLIESLIDRNPHAIFIIDRQGYVVKSNAAQNQFFQITSPEYNVFKDENIKNLGLENLLHGVFQGECIQTPPFQYDPRQLEHIRVESDAAFFRASAFPCFGENKEVTHIVVMLEDLTEMEQHREEAQKNYELYLELFENAADYIYILDLNGQLTSANKAARKFLGYTLEEISHLNISQLVHPDDLPVTRDMLQRKVQGERASGPYVLRIYTKEGVLKAIELKTRAIMSDGRITGVEGIARDISRSKQLEAQLIRAKEYTDRLVETANAIIISVDLKYRVTLFNRLAERITGFSKEDVLGQKYLSLFAPHRAVEQMKRDFQRLRKAAVPLTDQKALLLTREGEERIISWNVTDIEDSDGNHIGFMNIGQDITAQHKLQSQLQQAQKMEALGTLAGGVAHEFNNILGGILGYSSYIKTKLSKKHSCYADMEMIEQSGERAAELTGRLLTLVRKEAAKFQSLNLNETVESVISLLYRTIDKNITIKSTLQPLARAVRGDEGQLQQALINICLNARDAMPTGGTLTIETREVDIDSKTADTYHGAQSGHYLCISISDTGLGMKRETRKRIFEPFFTTKTDGKHTGLGLSMVYGIMQNHEGFINVYSEKGTGTAFHIYLPVTKKATMKKGLKKKDLPSGTETILVVDDEELILNLAEKLLTSAGYTVKLAGSGEDAIKRYESEWREIDLVILDMVMPGIGGGRTFEQLKQINPDVRVILSSGYSKEGAARSILESGGRDFLQKPFNMEGLLKKVRAVLDE